MESSDDLFPPLDLHAGRHVRLPAAPYTVVVPPPATTLPRSDSCGKHGRLTITPSHTHLFLPNFCRRWTCGLCAGRKVETILSSIALNLEATTPTPRQLSIIRLPAASMRNRIARQSTIPGRVTISRTDSDPWHVTTLPLQDPAYCGDVASTLTLASHYALALPGPCRTNWSGGWVEYKPETDSTVLLPDVDRRIAQEVFELTVYDATQRWDVAAWRLRDEMPKAVPIRWWRAKVRSSAAIFGS